MEQYYDNSMATDPLTIYDTTLRDGAQGEGVHFSLSDKLRLAEKLAAYGIHYVEGGWPGSNDKDREFFTSPIRNFPCDILMPASHCKLLVFSAFRFSLLDTYSLQPVAHSLVLYTHDAHFSHLPQIPTVR